MGSDEQDLLELRKLALEIAEMERPWWKRPAYILAALPTLLAVAALSIGFVNGYFSAQLTKLENQKHDLETQVRDFENTKTSLLSQNEQLRQDVIKKQDGLKRVQKLVSQLQSDAKIMQDIKNGTTRGIRFANESSKAPLLRYFELDLENLLSELEAVSKDGEK